jgi:hypothetical protein
MDHPAMSSEAKFRFRTSSEIMLRWLFSPSKVTRSIAAQQREVVARLFSYMSSDDDAETIFVQSKIAETAFVDGSVSVVWLSDDFVAPLIASLAGNLARELSPSDQAPFRPILEQRADSFFGYRLADIQFNGPMTDDQCLFLHLCSSAATKMLVTRQDVIGPALEACHEFGKA